MAQRGAVSTMLRAPARFEGRPKSNRVLQRATLRASDNRSTRNIWSVVKPDQSPASVSARSRKQAGWLAR